MKCFAGGTGHNSLTILLIFDIIISIVKVFLTIILKLLYTAGDSKMHLTETICQTCRDILDDEAVIVGTSAVTGTELDSITNQYSGIFNNPFLSWGRYRKGWFKTTLPISFQFHHAQMDGCQAARFLEALQNVFNTI